MGRKATSRPKIGYNMELLAAARLQQLAKLTSEKTGRNVDEGMIIEQVVGHIFAGNIKMTLFTDKDLNAIDAQLTPQVANNASGPSQ